MGDLPVQLRDYWIAGLTQVGQIPQVPLNDWLGGGNYYFTQVPGRRSFTVQLSDARPLLSALAFELNRLGGAALESWYNLSRLSKLPKSKGWFLIKSYYASFFAAHFLMLVFGRFVVRLDKGVVSNIEALARIYFGPPAVVAIEKGFYLGVYDPAANAVVFTKMSGVSGGAHEALWKVFDALLEDLTQQLMSVQPSSVEKQAAAMKLADLSRNLKFQATASSAWMSKIRNEVNYNQAMGVWFPYKQFEANFPSSFDFSKIEKQDPMGVDLNPAKATILERFLNTSLFLVSLAFGMAEEISVSVSSGRSFVDYGPLALKNHMAA